MGRNINLVLILEFFFREQLFYLYVYFFFIFDYVSIYYFLSEYGYIFVSRGYMYEVVKVCSYVYLYLGIYLGGFILFNLIVNFMCFI